MEKILLFQVSAQDADRIRKLGSNMKIRTERFGQEQFHRTLGELAAGQPAVSAVEQDIPLTEPAVNKFPGSLLVFAGVTDKHIDKMLFELRRQNIAVTYKAVLTDANQHWNIRRMFVEMERERLAYLSAQNKE